MATIQLRGHHLLCILTFVGKGYTPKFIKNMKYIVRKIGEGEAIKIVWGPDDICRGWLGHPNCHCHNAFEFAIRDTMALVSTSIILRKFVWPGSELRLSKTQIRRLRGAFRIGMSRQACVSCSWHSLCSGIARKDFEDTSL